MVVVVVDTTETFDDPLLTGISWTKLGLLILKGVAGLVLPRIVRDETARHFRSQLMESLTAARRDGGRINKLLRNPGSVVIAEVNVDIACQEYETYVSDRLVELRSTQPGYADISVERVANRALRVLRPFDAKGRGFKDAMLWEHVRALAIAADDNVVFVTNNTKDFCDDGELASDLKADLADAGVAEDKVVLCRDLKEVFDRFGLPGIQLLAALQRQLQEDSFPNFDAYEFFFDAYYDISDAIELSVEAWDFSELGSVTRRFLEQPRLSKLDNDPKSVTVGEVFRISDDDIAFSIDYELEGVVECTEIETFGEEHAPLEKEFSGKVVFNVSVSLTVEEKTGVVGDFEVDSVKLIPGREWPSDE